MKKILTLFISICTLLSLSACSSANKEDVMVFFDALDKTLDLKSGEFSGEVEYTNDDDVSDMYLTFSLIQTGNLQLAISLDLEANGNKLDDYIDFYIKDGKTYLNYMGTTSQSLAENIGVDPTEKLSVSNPFLDYTDSELASMFDSVTKDGNTYTMEIKPSMVSQLLDEYGSITVEKVTMSATIKNKYISKLSFDLSGSQTIEDVKYKTTIHFDGSLKNINTLKSISFPDNLENY